MPKVGIGKDVYTACVERIEWTFDTFEKVYLSFSGGKDSTTMMHMVMKEAIKRDQKIGILFVDLEGQYKVTIDHVRTMYEMYKDYIEPYWVCLPINLRNAVSVYEPHWICWDKDVEKRWVRPLPKESISDEKFFPFFKKGMEFEEFVPQFGDWYSQGKSCACFVGIRTDESLNRFRTVASVTKVTMEGKQYTTRVTPTVYNSYPIYDWRTKDIWTYHAKFPADVYNNLYTMMHKAGLTIHQMRICQPYGDDQRRGLWLFHLIEPETWGKVVARVNGANSGSLYVQDTGNITGYNKITLPEGHTWQTFATLLVKSMPPKTREHYQNKFFIFVKWWKDRGYPDGIPDFADPKLESAKKVPSWRRVCKTLLRNDYWCKGLSFTQHKSDAYKKYLDYVKNKREVEKWSM
jgi:predicted phosphoadenosine phosphosulfate sulfurtransferase